ncbi:MAG: type II secretion system protein [Minisyncoccia bacterium]
MKKGFTLIELIIVLAIIAVLVAILIAVLKPTVMFARLRDSQRSADLNTISKAIDIYISDFSQDPSKIVMTNTTTVTIATSAASSQVVGPIGGCVGSATPTIFYSAEGIPSGTSTLPSSFVAVRATSSRDVGGNGWLPVPLNQSGVISLTSLPIDPRNSKKIDDKPSYYYTYVCKSDFSYQLLANLEINTDSEKNDGGSISTLYEVGPNKTLITGTSSWFYPSE